MRLESELIASRRRLCFGGGLVRFFFSFLGGGLGAFSFLGGGLEAFSLLGGGSGLGVSRFWAAGWGLSRFWAVGWGLSRFWAVGWRWGFLDSGRRVVFLVFLCFSFNLIKLLVSGRRVGVIPEGGRRSYPSLPFSGQAGGKNSAGGASCGKLCGASRRRGNRTLEKTFCAVFQHTADNRQGTHERDEGAEGK